MKTSEIKRLTDEAWRNLERAYDSPGWASDLVVKALAENERGERSHRAMGKRWLGRKPGYRLGISETARYNIARMVGLPCKKPKNWIEVAGYRADWILAMAVREHLQKLVNGYALSGAAPDERLAAARAALKPCKAFAAIDYATDIATQ